MGKLIIGISTSTDEMRAKHNLGGVDPVQDGSF